MTDEQFEKIMKKLDELKEARQALPVYYHGYPNFTAPNPNIPAQPRYYDGLPAHWVIPMSTD